MLDIGGGKKWQFRDERKRFTSLKVIALDISQEELSFNNDVDEKIVFAMGTSKCSPLSEKSADLVTSHMVMEHIRDNTNTVREVFRVLKSGGKFISVIPGKFALFAVINQLLPDWLGRKILYAINPEAKGTAGFKAYYNKTFYPALRKLLEDNGFTEIEFAFDYNQSGYFSFFWPFGVVSLVWDFVMYLLNVKPMCAYICFIARKP